MHCTAAYVNGHLVDMDALLDTELGDENIKGSVENPHNTGLANNGSVSLRQVRNQQAQEQMRRLLLRQLGRILFATSWAECEQTIFWKGTKPNVHIALLGDLGYRVTVHRKLGIGG
jgi:hypothetical protein